MDPYGQLRKFHQDISGQLTVAAGTDDATLVALRALHTIYIQKYHVQITTGSGAITWNLKDGDGLTVSGLLSAAVAPVSFERDFGARGFALGEGKAFLLDVSAAGAVGVITWEGYKALTGVGSPQTPAAPG